MSTFVNTSGTTSSSTTNSVSFAQSSTRFEDLWTFNFSAENCIQHKIRVVKVNNQPYIAFSKYFFNPNSQSFQPSKKHYFIPESRWGELQSGLAALYKFISRHRSGSAPATSVQPGVVIGATTGGTTVSNRQSGERVGTATVNHSAFASGTSFSKFASGPSYSSNPNPVPEKRSHHAKPPIINFITSSSSTASKRGRGRPTKESVTIKKNKSSLGEHWLSEVDEKSSNANDGCNSISTSISTCEPRQTSIPREASAESASEKEEGADEYRNIDLADIIPE